MSRSYLTGLNLNKNELLNAAIQNLAVAPSNPSVGQIYFDTDLNHLRQWDGTQWLDYLTAESGAGYITSVGSNLSVTDQQLDLGANVIITDSSQTLSNKIYQTPVLRDKVSFTNSSNTEILSIEQAYTGTVRVIGTDDISIRSTGGDIILYPGNDDGGTGKAYVHWGNDATGSGAGNEIATLGATQTFSNKTYSTPTLKGSVSFTNSADTEILSITQTGVGTVRINATDDLSLRSTNGDIILYPGNELGGVGKVYIGYGNANAATGAGVAGAGNEVATLGDTQTFTNKTIGDGLTFSNGTDASSAVYLGGTDLTVEAAGSLYLAADTADINLYANGNVYVGASASGNEVATHAYVDGLVQGLNVKESVRLASAVDIDIANATAVDDTALVEGDRVLLFGQSTATENGIYAFAEGVLVRATDADPVVDELGRGAYTLVTDGTYASTGWIVSGLVAGATIWSQFSAANEYTAGNGIDISGNEISVALDGGSLSVSGSGLRAQVAEGGGLNIDATYGLYAQLGDGLITDTMSGDIVFDTANGYGVRKYAAQNALIEPTSNVASWEVVHNLNTRDVTIQVYTLDTYEQVEVDTYRLDANTVGLSWVATANVEANTYRVVVVG